METRTRGPLTYPQFWWVWAGESVAILGDVSFLVGFSWLILDLANAATLGAVLLTVGIPRGVLMLVGGALTDRFSPRTVMFVSHIARGLAVAALTALFLTGTLAIWHLFAIGLVFGVADAFFWPASVSIIPTLVPREHLARANALAGSGEQFARLAGPLIGGALVSLGGLGWVFGLNVFAMFFAAASLLRVRRVVPEDQEQLSVRGVLRQIRSGLAYAASSAETRIVVALIAAATLSYSGLFAVGLPALAKSFDSGPFVLGLMLSAWGLGQLAGTLSASFTGLPQRWGLLIIGMTFLEGVSFAVLGVVPHYLVAVVLLALLGFGVAYSTDVALPTFVQTTTPPEMLGRVSSVLELPRVVLEPVSMAMMGLLATGDVRWAFVAAAIPMLAVSLTLASSRRARNLRTA
ncbi:MFS transporter [Actinoplanes solisilvae]|uniref:MFS transporter n=1 Tax=Actinoplanes solisilvae TaxID=2486853 RepID=UPI000FDA0D69|nr:MFS transporter [Actinoplanes solisilvae]